MFCAFTVVVMGRKHLAVVCARPLMQPLCTGPTAHTVLTWFVQTL